MHLELYHGFVLRLFLPASKCRNRTYLMLLARVVALFADSRLLYFGGQFIFATD